ncbi:MAG: hypothetical protein AAGG01_10870, partial [Planctomycetota bacterium]
MRNLTTQIFFTIAAVAAPLAIGPEPLGTANERTALQGIGGIVGVTDTTYEFRFSGMEEPQTLLNILDACAEATPVLFRFDALVEDALSRTTVRLTGTKSVEKEKLASFLTVALLISDFSTTQTGTDEAPILSIASYGETTLPNRRRAGRTPTVMEVEGGFEVNLPAGKWQWSLSLLDLLSDFAAVTEVQFTWTQETEKKLELLRPHLTGRRFLSSSDLVPFLDSLVSL